MTQKIDVHITRADGSEIVLTNQSSGNPAVRRRINANLDTARRIEVRATASGSCSLNGPTASPGTLWLAKSSSAASATSASK